ncbi:MAG: DUF6596 domain-containing protein [Spirochaetota bacterium]
MRAGYLEYIEKRLYRARGVFRKIGGKPRMPPIAELLDRTATVLATLYLMFTKRYYSPNQTETEIIQKDICLEALRLVLNVNEKPELSNSETQALPALFAFHAARFEARQNPTGELIGFSEQDRLLYILPSPSIEISRCYVLAKSHSPQEALIHLDRLSQERPFFNKMANYHAAVGLVLEESKNAQKAKMAWLRAAELSKHKKEIEYLKKRAERVQI